MQVLQKKNLSRWKRFTSFVESNQFIFIYLAFYFILNLLFLTNFPYIHSDESWLSGLSRHILETGSIKVTEPFFDAYIRYPHAIRIIFHLIQGIFIYLFGYQIFTFRLISLIFSIATLFLFYKIAEMLLKSKPFASLCLLLLSLDIQFIYAAHFARQEIILLFFMLLSFYGLLKSIEQHRYRNDLIIGSVIGLSIGFHPNSFIIACTLGCIYTFYILNDQLTLKNLILLIFSILAFALFFVVLSLYMDPQYLSHYLEHGKNFGVRDSIFNKLSDFLHFYGNIFNQSSIEYYMPNVCFQLILFAVVLCGTAILMLKNRFLDSTLNLLLLWVLSINLGLLLIGRYNVTSVIFVFPAMYLLSIYCLINTLPQTKKWLSGLTLLITILITLIQITPYKQSYNDYLTQISAVIGDSEKVLGNLNSEYAFSDGQLLDYRNLQYLNTLGISFSDYIRANQIDTILYYDELDFIIQNEPTYNVMYGDLTGVYDEMKDFLKNNCTETGQFISPTYGTELWPLIDQRDWTVHVFKVTADW